MCGQWGNRGQGEGRGQQLCNEIECKMAANEGNDLHCFLGSGRGGARGAWNEAGNGSLYTVPEIRDSGYGQARITPFATGCAAENFCQACGRGRAKKNPGTGEGQQQPNERAKFVLCAR